MKKKYIQGDSKLLSGFPWPINGNPDNNLESLCTLTILLKNLCQYREVGWDGRDWIDLAQDRDRRRAYVNAVMNLRVP
jgi:hypothetical protein